MINNIVKSKITFVLGGSCDLMWLVHLHMSTHEYVIKHLQFQAVYKNNRGITYKPICKIEYKTICLK